MSDVVSDLIASDDSDMHVMSMLRGQDMRAALDDTGPVTGDPFAGPFAHIVVDEAQELTDAQWRMLIRRCPSRSFTIVGDRAQARQGFRESWLERLDRVGLPGAKVSELTVNYRTPVEVMDVAAPAIRAVLPDANVPTSIRSTGIPVRYDDSRVLDEVLRSWLDAHPEGVAAVIGSDLMRELPDRVRALTPTLAKGLEFDLVVLINPATFGDTLTAGVDRYVAMTRATQELVVLGD
jgi:superfamily I DNA/RNA helicase